MSLKCSLLLMLLLSLVLIGYYTLSSDNEKKNNNFIHGTVLEVVKDTTDNTNMQRTQTVRIRVDEKSYNNKIITMVHTANIASVHHIILKKNDAVIMWFSGDDASLENGNIYAYGRDKYLLYLGILFVLFILIVGGAKGISSLFSLAFTMSLIFLGFFPMILNNMNPITAAVIVCIAATGITLLSVGGFCAKTYSAIMGTVGGIFLSIILIYLFGEFTHIQGIQDENVELISYFPQGGNFNFKELLYAGIIIGSLGAIMDVCMSIASAMDEICEANPRMTNINLLIAGMRVGRDAIGTMSNTLILAYVGSSINLLIVFYIYGQTLTQFINSDGIASEILRTLTGSIGLVLAIPITSVSYLLFRKSYY